MNTRTNIFTTFILCLLGASQAHQGLARTFGNVASGPRSAKTTQLLNQLCNESQDENSMERDACYGCFYRATQSIPGYPMLTAMSACADKYLDNTDYGHCRAYLKNATVNANGTPMIVYCTFFQCIRQVNKDTLVSLKHVDHKSDGVTKEEKFAIKKKRMAMDTSQTLVFIKGICVVQPKNETTAQPNAIPHTTRYSRIEDRRVEHWGHNRRNFNRNYRRSFRRDPIMHSRGPRNVFQFFIDGREPRQAFRQYDRMYSSQNQMRNYESNYRRYEARY